MENILYYLMVFIMGILFNSLFGYMYGLGGSITMMKTSISDCLIMMAKNVQSTYEINQLKYMALEASGRDEKFVEFQKNIDQRELNSMRNTAIRNFLNSIPPKYDNIVPFHDWVTAMNYLDIKLKEEK